MKHFCLKLEILVEFILLYWKFVRNNFMIYTVSVWNMYWVRSTCGSKWEKPTTDNGKFTVEHRARSRMGNRHRSTKLLRWTIQQKQQSVQPYLLVLSINAFDRNNHNKFHFQTESQFCFSSSSSFPLSDIISKIFVFLIFI